MPQSISKSDFLNDLRTRNEKISSIVQTEFMPLDKPSRSTQPEPKEWCVDQCFKHLILTFDLFLPQAIEVLKRTKDAESLEHFTPSWLGSRRFYLSLFDPGKKAKTRPSVIPSEHYYPDVFDSFLKQKERMVAMLDDAVNADLQARCWFQNLAPINLGDYLEQFVLHDELHIDQARRALAAYRQSVAPVPD